MNDKVGVSVLKCLITAISVVVALPGLWEEDLKLVTLTLLVFYMSKIVEAFDGMSITEAFPHERIVRIIQCAIGVVAVSGCFFYLAVSISEKGIEIITLNPNIKFVYSAGLVFSASAFFAIDVLFCGIAFYKHYRTVKKVMKIINK